MGAYRDETELLMSSVRGDNKAFGLIVERYQSLVCAITLSATNDIGKSEELAQQVFLNAWQNRGQLRDLRKFRNWLCAIARNVINNSLKDKKRDLLGRAMPMDENISAESGDIGPEEKATLQEQQRIMADALSNLSEDYRQVLVLFYREEKSIKTVAEQLELSEEAVKKRLSRGREMLREHIESMVERTLKNTKPGKVFTASVLAGIAGIGIGSSSAACVAVGAKAGAGAAVSGTAAAIISVAASIIVIGGGTFAGYKYFSAGDKATKPVMARQASEDNIGIGQGTQTEIEATAARDVNTQAGTEGNMGGDTRKAETLAVKQQEKFVFKPRGVLSGMITDIKTGKPVKDAEIILAGVGETHTDANGFYFFEKTSRDGTYTVIIYSTDYAAITDWAECPQIEIKNSMQQVRDFKLDRAVKIAITVTDERGKPAKGATFNCGLINSPPNKSSFLSQARTDANGFAVVGGLRASAEPYQIVANYNGAVGYIETTLNNPGTMPSASIVIEDGVKVRGRAVYEDCVAASDLSLYATPDWWRLHLLTTITKIDANGFFELEHITAGKYRIKAIVPNSNENKQSGTIKDVAEVQLPPDGNLLKIKVPMKSPQNMGKICGRMRFVNEKPVYVNVQADTVNLGFGNSTTVLPSSQEATFVIRRLEPGTYRVTFSGGVENKVIEGVKVPGPDIDVELVSISKRDLNGIVIDAATRRPVTKFRARLSFDAHEKEYPGLEPRWHGWVDFSDKDGKFSLRPTGSDKFYYVEVTDGNGWGKSGKVDLDDEVMIELTAAGSVRGIVVDEGGKGIEGATVTAGSQISTNTTNVKQVSETGTAQTDKDGRFIIRNLPCGKDRLEARHRDYCNSEDVDVEIKSRQITDGVKIVLGKGGIIEGYVYDESGEPAVSEILTVNSNLYAQEKSTTGAVTDANGFYRITNLPAQMCSVVIQLHGNGAGVNQRFIMPSRSEAARLDFGGKPVIQGKLALAGEECGNRKLILTSGNAHLGDFVCTTVTKADGSFTFGGVPAGKYSIYIDRDEQSNSSLLAGIITSGRDQNIGIIPEQDRCKLTVHLRKDAEVKALYLQQQGATSIETKNLAFNDANSPQVFKNLAKGDYKLQAYQRNGFMIVMPIQMREAEQEITFEIPQGISSVAGKVLGNQASGLFITNGDETLMAIVNIENGGYKIVNLPTGHYKMMFASGVNNKIVLREFDVAEGMNQTIDVAIPAVEESESLIVYPADAKGFLISDADVQLEGRGGTYKGQRYIGMGYAIAAKPGEYVLKVTIGGKTVTKNVTIEAGRPNPNQFEKAISIRFDK